jgi:hypothetical protein
MAWGVFEPWRANRVAISLNCHVCAERVERTTRRCPQMYPHESVAVGGSCWTLADEIPAHKYEA